MADNNKATKATTPSDLSDEVLSLLNEFMVNARQITPKRATKRSIRRSLATLSAIIQDINEEVSK